MKVRAFPIYKESLHHAYCITGDTESICEDLFHFIERELRVARVGNPDFYHEAFESLGIDDARHLADRQLQKSFSGSLKIFVIVARDITSQAQNALLKLFEEPTRGTHFFLIMRGSEGLLPTLRSRLFLIEYGRGIEENTEAKKFLKMPIATRIAFAKKFADKETAKAEFVNFVDALLSEVRPRMLKEKTVELERAVEGLLTARSYSTDQGSSVKLLFDLIISVLPVR